MPYLYTWATSDFSMEVGETVTIVLHYVNVNKDPDNPGEGNSIPIFEDGVQIGTTTTSAYEYTPTSNGTHTLHYFNTIDCSPLTVTVTGGGGAVSGNDTTTLNGALTELGETLAENLETMGVADADASDGLTTLAEKILDIEQSGQEIVSFDNLTTEFNYTRKRGDYGFSVIIPNGVTSLGDYCFQSCTGLTNVTIPSSVTSLGNFCFYGCYSLTSITILNGVTSLGSYCFTGCANLTNITIPSSVTSLGNSCFNNCLNLVDYQLYWETPPITWSSTLMPNNADTYFTIPNGTTANYTAKSFPSDKLIERNE